MSQEDVFVINNISSVRALLLVVLVYTCFNDISCYQMKKKNCCTKNIKYIQILSSFQLDD